MTSYSDLPDEALEEITKDFVRTHPNSGGWSLAVFFRRNEVEGTMQKSLRESGMSRSKRS